MRVKEKTNFHHSIGIQERETNIIGPRYRNENFSVRYTAII